MFPVISATLPAIFGIVKTPIHSKRHVIDIASAIIYPGTRDPRTRPKDDPVLIIESLPGTTSAKHDIVKDIGAAFTTAKIT